MFLALLCITTAIIVLSLGVGMPWLYYRPAVTKSNSLNYLFFRLFPRDRMSSSVIGFILIAIYVGTIVPLAQQWATRQSIERAHKIVELVEPLPAGWQSANMFPADSTGKIFHAVFAHPPGIEELSIRSLTADDRAPAADLLDDLLSQMKSGKALDDDGSPLFRSPLIKERNAFFVAGTPLCFAVGQAANGDHFLVGFISPPDTPNRPVQIVARNISSDVDVDLVKGLFARVKGFPRAVPKD